MKVDTPAPGRPLTASDGVTVEQVRLARLGETILPPTSLRAGPGEAVAITGPNGAGKTTLLRAIAGIERLDSGSVVVDGIRADERSAEFRRAVASLIGRPSTARDLTVHEHLAIVAMTWGAARDEAAAAADGVIDECAITELRQRFLHEVSSGQAQLIHLALTLVRPFRILLLDEPEQRLDGARRDRVAEILAARLHAGATVVYATHSAALIEALGSRTARIGNAA
ncbi:ABC transporter ATP-binding protein [Galbitalea soli]|uniref:ATP-binding cassette domain-containing protein n=1 Tax=Galbitalea soli TaxID=1268042 RepID=A0A7C9PNX4_9MICO|nr:ATP-binding cassette domain-containing protein [Galbitalea soli]NEM91887.1 ATP-binding cassette domain-containing protein [Galbitalea soli]NYJ29277.1 ABC-type multidrug transport system ATPase subunit [Galbitalea soli]